MKDAFSRRALFSSIAIVSLAVTLSGLSDVAQAADGVFMLGIVAPISGANSRYGAYAMQGAELAVKDISDAGGTGGKKLQIDSGDSQCAPVEGMSAMQRLINEVRVKFVIGATRRLDRAPVAGTGGAPLLTPVI